MAVLLLSACPLLDQPCFTSAHTLLTWLSHPPHHRAPWWLPTCLSPAPAAGFPGNWWANLTSTPPIMVNSIMMMITPNLPPSNEACCHVLPAFCCTESSVTPGLLLWTRRSPYPINHWCRWTPWSSCWAITRLAGCSSMSGYDYRSETCTSKRMGDLPKVIQLESSRVRIQFCWFQDPLQLFGTTGAMNHWWWKGRKSTCWLGKHSLL